MDRILDVQFAYKVNGEVLVKESSFEEVCFYNSNRKILVITSKIRCSLGKN